MPATMEPLSIAAGGLELVGPIYKLARLIIARTQAFRKAPALLHELRAFGHDLDSGQLHLSVRFVESFLSEAAGSFKEDPERRQLRLLALRYLERLKESLERTEALLAKCAGDDGKISRLFYAMRGERALKREREERRRWQADFVVFVVLVEKSRVLQARDVELKDDQLRITTRNEEGFLGRPLPTAGHLTLASAELRRGSDIENVDVLIESLKITSRGAAERISRNLGHDFPSGGVLKCLGFRSGPSIDLVFQVPDRLSRPRSLKSVIEGTALAQSTQKPGIRARAALALGLSKAVLSVHAAKMVHKCIRLGTILLFDVETGGSPYSTFDCIGEPYLTSWKMLRTQHDLSAWTGEEGWVKNLYRHPERYGLRAEQRYHMGHDLYSLGVCMLEIGLWEPLILRDGSSPSPSDRYRLAFESLRDTEEQGAAVQEDMTVAKTVQKILLELARKDLRYIMGQGYADVVETCLTRVDDLGKLEETSKDGSEVASAHNEWVIQPLAAMLSDMIHYPDDGESIPRTG